MSLGDLLKSNDKYNVDEMHTPAQYQLFEDFILQMLRYE